MEDEALRVRTPELLVVMHKLERMIGYVPVGMLDLMNILSHPDMIQDTRKFLDACEKNA